MNDPFAWLTHWLADVLLLGSMLLLLAHGALTLLRQPAQGMTLAWGVTLGLLVLLVVSAFPLWPRQSLWPVQRQENRNRRLPNLQSPSLSLSPSCQQKRLLRQPQYGRKESLQAANRNPFS